LSQGHSWALVSSVLLCSTATISRWKDRFESGGVERTGLRPPQARLEENPGRAATLLANWAWLLVFWVKVLTPRRFGYFRSRRPGFALGPGAARRWRWCFTTRTG
jgi:hypothetical protein